MEEGAKGQNQLDEAQALWANRPRLKSEELRKKAEEESLDKEKLLLGHMLSTITGDDG